MNARMIIEVVPARRSDGVKAAHAAVVHDHAIPWPRASNQEAGIGRDCIPDDATDRMLG